MAITASHRNKSQNCSFAPPLISWSAVYSASGQMSLSAGSSWMEAEIPVQGHFLKQYKYLRDLLKELFLESLNLYIQRAMRKGSFRLVNSILLCVFVGVGILVIFQNLGLFFWAVSFKVLYFLLLNWIFNNLHKCSTVIKCHKELLM